MDHPPPVHGINPADFQIPPAPANNNNNNNNQFGAVRDRLFHAILVKIALGYSRAVPDFGRKIIECLSLIFAISLLFMLLFVHYVSSRSDSNCLDNLQHSWPKDGVIRLEVVENLDVLEYKEEWIRWYTSERSNLVCNFNIADVFRYGPKILPAEIRQKNVMLKQHAKRMNKEKNESGDIFSTLLSYLSVIFMDPSNDHNPDRFPTEAVYNMNADDMSPTPFWIPADQSDPFDKEAQAAFSAMFKQRFDRSRIPQSVYRMEYSMRYGLLRLPVDYREAKNIETLSVRLDADDKCFGDSVTRWTLKQVLGYEDSVMVSLRKLAANETVDESGLGYLHNLDTNEHYHFIRNSMSKASYISAAIIMVCFTFAISLLLHFSHHQIFVFIVDLLHMFELNQPLHFPAAPLLTVVLALVGMEAIMSEIFADTSTAFYVILIVWIADQFDAICCHSPISKRYWLRFFYLYQFFFYAYQYRFGGQYGGIALLTSIAFIVHSMIFFFHHYEIPLILYREELQRLFALQTARPMVPPATASSTTTTAEQPSSAADEQAGGPPSTEQQSTLNSSADADDSSTDHPPSSQPPSSTEESVANGVVAEALEELLLVTDNR